jgi:hypothetical protein
MMKQKLKRAPTLWDGREEVLRVGGIIETGENIEELQLKA